MAARKIHRSVTVDRVIGCVEESTFGLSSLGICTACGEEIDGVEPDARKMICECCESPSVYGAEELLIRIA